MTTLSNQESRSTDETLVNRARAFAVGAHAAIGQKTPYTGEDYSTHLEAVSQLLSRYTSNSTALAAALLHDVIEDTHVSYELLRREFGIEVATIVQMVSKISKREDGDRATRVAIDIEHYALGNADAHDVKLCDIIVNVSSIVDRAVKFAAVYVPEKQVLIERLTKGNPQIRALAEETVLSELKRLGYR